MDTLQPLDTLLSVETPEGIDIDLRLAGPVVRALAWFIDQLIRLAMYIASWLVFGLIQEWVPLRAASGLLLLWIFAVEWFYPVLFEIGNRGATPGKKILGIRVVNENSTPVSWSGSIIRNLLRWADFMPFFYGTGLLSMLLSSRFARLGDIAGATVVIYDTTHASPTTLPEAKPVKPSVTLSSEEQQALVSFSERAGTERRNWQKF
jgi:uncharacterized RDD family membrane protein YckC